MKLISVVVLLALSASAGCTNSKNRLAFDGEYFRTKVAKVDKQRDVFTVTIRDVDRSLDGAREAGRHAGVSHCVKAFGSSKINWSVGPDTPPEELRIVDNTLVFQGVCPQV